MPAFEHSLSDGEVAEIAAYMRRRYAPQQAPWQDLARAAAHVRQLPAHP
jgi:nicotinate dehydrogenase subunit B